MIKSGHIQIGIDKRVYFEPRGLEKPKKQQFKTWDPFDEMPAICFDKLSYKKAMKDYKASKQLVEVENARWSKKLTKWIIIRTFVIFKTIKDNQLCEASIKDNKATIINLLIK